MSYLFAIFKKIDKHYTFFFCEIYRVNATEHADSSLVAEQKPRKHLYFIAGAFSYIAALFENFFSQ